MGAMLDWTHICIYYTSSLHKSPNVYAKDRCRCIPTKRWFPHAPVSVITCCTQRNQALLWTSLPQTHGWCCYYSSLPEFSGKEGLALWHTSCPLKRPTERWLFRPSFQTPAFMAVWKAISWVQSHGLVPPWLQSSVKMSVQIKQIFIAIDNLSRNWHLISALCL